MGLSLHQKFGSIGVSDVGCVFPKSINPDTALLSQQMDLKYAIRDCKCITFFGIKHTQVNGYLNLLY